MKLQSVPRVFGNVLGFLRAASRKTWRKNGRTKHTLRIPYRVLSPPPSPSVNSSRTHDRSLSEFDSPLQDLSPRLEVRSAALGSLRHAAPEEKKLPWRPAAPEEEGYYRGVLPLSRVPRGELSLLVSHGTRLIISVRLGWEETRPVPRGFVRLPPGLQLSTLKFSLDTEDDTLIIEAKKKTRTAEPLFNCWIDNFL